MPKKGGRHKRGGAGGGDGFRDGDKKQIAPASAPPDPNDFPSLAGLKLGRVDAGPGATRGAAARPETEPMPVAMELAASPARPAPLTATGTTAAPAAGAGVTTKWKLAELPQKKEDFILPLRTTDGTLGEPLQIKTNHFPLTITFKEDRYFHYDIKIQRVKSPAAAPPKPAAAPPASKLPKRVLQKIIKCVVRQLTLQLRGIGIASDFNSNVYSTKELEQVGLIGVVDMGKLLKELGPKDPDPYEMEAGQFEYTLIRAPDIPTREVAALVNNMRGNPNSTGGDMVELETLFNAVIKAMPTRPYLCIGRSLVEFPADDGHWLGGGLRAWPGVTACINPGWKLTMNLMLSYVTVKVGAPVLDALKELFGGQDASNVTEWSRDDVDKASEYMNSTKVHYSPMAWKDLSCVVERVCQKSVSQAKFPYAHNGQPSREVSVFEYFKLAYKRTLKFPNGPVLITRPKGNMIPAEICTIKAGQSVNRKLDGNQTTQMKNVAQKKPDALELEINNRMRALNLVDNDLFKKFGMNVDPNMLKIKARVLPTPAIRYTDAKKEKGHIDVSPDKGAWMIWQHAFKFPISYPFEIKWAILAIETSQTARWPLSNDSIATFKREVLDNGRKCGLTFSPDASVSVTQSLKEQDHEHAKNVKTFKDTFQKLKNEGVKLVFVIIPGKPSRFYAQSKQAAELEKHGVGLLTQGILRNNFTQRDTRKLKQIVQNLLLKINSKFGGVTHHVIPSPVIRDPEFLKKISFTAEPMMIFGADVRHPPPGTVVKGRDGKPVPVPSFAAVTGTTHSSCMPTMMDVRAQVKPGAGAAEVIKDLKEIVENMIGAFVVKYKGRLPSKLLYFRDGVGQGQFKEVLHVELRAIRDACGKFDALNKGVPYQPKITFVTVQKRHKTRFIVQVANGMTTNAPPGTVVDTDIVHPTEVDFFLQSHQAIQGTSHPTRYHLLHDDSDFSLNELEILTYCMCHMYVRCNRSVKIPAATYYAHWAATRAEVFAQGNEHLYADVRSLNDSMKRSGIFLKEHPMHFV